MNTTQPKAIPDHLTVVATLAHVLERLERSSVPVNAEQYRAVVKRLAQELGKVQVDPVLQAMLDSHPATAELYENLNYAHAGLCRSSLEFSLTAELRAKDAIRRAAKPPRDISAR